jgi:hypothetical protein
VAAGCAGALVTLLQFAVIGGGAGAIPGRSVLERPWQAVPQSWPGLIARFQLLLATPPAAAAICAVSLALAVHRRKLPGAWFLAFFAGLALPFVFSNWLVG